MNNPYNSGTPDWYYSGPQADLWVEYKFLRDGKIPVRAPIDISKHYLSSLQKDWICGRAREGRKVLVIVGCKDGGVVFSPGELDVPLPADEFRRRLRTRVALAKLITTITGAFPVPP